MEGRRVIDAHVHQWDLRGTPREGTGFVKLLGWNRSLMHWLAGKVFPREVVEFFGGPREVLSDYLPRDYRSDIAGHEVPGFVHVEAGWRGKGVMGPVAETRWLESLGDPLLKAIVGFADLQLGDAVADVLEAQLAARDDCPFDALCLRLEGDVGVCLLACEDDGGCRMPSAFSYSCRRSFGARAPGEPVLAPVGVCAPAHCLTRGCIGSARCDC